ncbi:MgtC/SapB family protein [candidate division KSB1 bacterium]|nr:MgtC/SapB family protein [candidate division KSB1 bacterium]
MQWNYELIIIAKTALAMFLGGLLGLEREFSQKPAGFRTHILVAGAASLFICTGDWLVCQFTADNNLPVQADPLRVVQAIVTGISFLGAGTIIRQRDSARIEGLTTAASILLASAIGICIAIDLYVLGIGITMLTLLVLRLLGIVERKLL